MEVVGLVVGVLGLGFAVWQYLDGRHLGAMLRTLPRQIATQMSQPSKLVLLDEAQPERRPFRISYGDIDNDGKDELLVQYAAGAHGTALQVYAMRGWDFKFIGELGVGTPEGFTVADFDGDGRMEVGTRETDWSLDLPYYLAPRMQLWYRWNGSAFDKVTEIKDYTKADVEALRHKLDSPLT